MASIRNAGRTVALATSLLIVGCSSVSPTAIQQALATLDQATVDSTSGSIADQLDALLGISSGTSTDASAIGGDVALDQLVDPGTSTDLSADPSAILSDPTLIATDPTTDPSMSVADPAADLANLAPLTDGIADPTGADANTAMSVQSLRRLQSLPSGLATASIPGQRNRFAYLIAPDTLQSAATILNQSPPQTHSDGSTVIYTQYSTASTYVNRSVTYDRTGTLVSDNRQGSDQVKSSYPSGDLPSGIGLPPNVSLPTNARITEATNTGSINTASGSATTTGQKIRVFDSSKTPPSLFLDQFVTVATYTNGNPRITHAHSSFNFDSQGKAGATYDVNVSGKGTSTSLVSGTPGAPQSQVVSTWVSADGKQNSSETRTFSSNGSVSVRTDLKTGNVSTYNFGLDGKPTGTSTVDKNNKPLWSYQVKSDGTKTQDWTNPQGVNVHSETALSGVVTQTGQTGLGSKPIWTKTTNPDKSFKLVSTNASTSVTTTSQINSDGVSGTVTATDSSSKVIWVKTINKDKSYTGATTDSKGVTTTRTYSTSQQMVSAVAKDAGGNQLWSKTINANGGYVLVTNQANGNVVTNTMNKDGTGTIAAKDKSGNTLWTKTLNADKSSVVVTTDAKTGATITTTYSADGTGSAEAKGADGKIQWSKSWGKDHHGTISFQPRPLKMPEPKTPPSKPVTKKLTDKSLSFTYNADGSGFGTVTDNSNKVTANITWDKTGNGTITLAAKTF